jgi:Na+/citrate or Na+/malate symporter
MGSAVTIRQTVCFFIRFTDASEIPSSLSDDFLIICVRFVIGRIRLSAHRSAPCRFSSKTGLGKFTDASEIPSSLSDDFLIICVRFVIGRIRLSAHKSVSCRFSSKTGLSFI